MRWHLAVPAALSTVLLSFTQLHAADAPNKIKPAMILSGKDSAVSKPMTELCRSEKELQAVWKKHQDGDDRHNCPDLDFNSFILIAVFDGTYEDGSWIGLSEVVEDEDSIRLRFYSGEKQTGVVETEDESESDRLQRITRSYAFIVLPASNKAVVIEKDCRSLLDGPPKWVEQKRFPPIEK